MLYRLYGHVCITGLSTEEFESKKMWLKHSAEPWPKVLELWKETFANRQHEVRNGGNIADARSASVNGVSQIFKEWPRYKDASGYTLVRK